MAESNTLDSARFVLSHPLFESGKALFGFFEVVDSVNVLDSEIVLDLESMELDSKIILDSVALDSKFLNLDSKPLADSKMSVDSESVLDSGFL